MSDVGRALLGAVIGNAHLRAAFPDGITDAVFETHGERVVFAAASDLLRDGKPPDLVLLTNHLRDTGRLDAAGGAAYVAELTSLPTFPSQIGYYAEALKREAADREARRAVLEAAEELKKGSPGLIVPDLLQRLTGYGGGSERQRFSLVRLDSVEVKPTSWIVRNLVEADSFCCLYGDSGAGKSFLAIELAACIATGTPFYGLPVKKGPVVYLAGEGRSGLARRFKAWGIARGVPLDGAPIFLSVGAMALIEAEVMAPVCNSLEKLIREIGNPSLVILDTWSRVLGGDDSSTSDAAAGVCALDGLRERFGNFAALVVHHCGNSDKGRVRGWSGLRAAVDMEYRAERGADGLLRLECTKSKDTGIMDPMAFRFTSVELPLRNESGEHMTSAVLDRVDWTPAPTGSAAKGPGKNQSLALDVLQGLDRPGAWVGIREWRDACQNSGLARNRFAEVKDSLEASGGVEIMNSMVRIPCSSEGASVRPNTPPKGGVYSDGHGHALSDRPKASEMGKSDEMTESPETLPPEIPPEYRDIYEAAVTVLVKRGRPQSQAETEAVGLTMEFIEAEAERSASVIEAEP